MLKRKEELLSKFQLKHVNLGAYYVGISWIHFDKVIVDVKQMGPPFYKTIVFYLMHIMP